jgi:D-alanine-D-alanine ligase
MTKLNIAVITGGDSGEFEISMKSGRVVAEMLDASRFNTFLIHIRGSNWFYEQTGQKFPVEKNDFSLTVDSRKILFDCVFCAIHGTPGENGKLPAYFEMLKIPYTSSDSLVSALTFNKNFCNRVVATFGVQVAGSVHLFKNQDYVADDILQTLKLPVFVKPNGGGSSVGMSKVKQKDELPRAIQRAFMEDDEVLIEEFIDGRELTCAVLSNNGQLLVLPICEIISKKEFFDFEAKYDPSLADEIVPADIDQNLEIEVKQTSAMLYKKLKCRGVVRADFIYSEKEKTLYFIEINTVPGLTKESIVPKMAKEMGISLSELFAMMIDETLR